MNTRPPFSVVSSIYRTRTCILHLSRSYGALFSILPSPLFQSPFPDCITHCMFRNINHSPCTSPAFTIPRLIYLDRRAVHSLSCISFVRTLSIRVILRICTAVGCPEQLCNSSFNFIPFFYLFICGLIPHISSRPPPVTRNVQQPTYSSPLSFGFLPMTTWLAAWTNLPLPRLPLNNRYLTRVSRSCITTSIPKYRTSSLEFILNIPLSSCTRVL